MFTAQRFLHVAGEQWANITVRPELLSELRDGLMPPSIPRVRQGKGQARRPGFSIGSIKGIRDLARETLTPCCRCVAASIRCFAIVSIFDIRSSRSISKQNRQKPETPANSASALRKHSNVVRRDRQTVLAPIDGEPRLLPTAPSVPWHPPLCPDWAVVFAVIGHRLTILPSGCSNSRPHRPWSGPKLPQERDPSSAS